MLKRYDQGCRQLLTSLGMLEEIAARILFLTDASADSIRDQIRWQEQTRKERFKLMRRRIINPFTLLLVWTRGTVYQLWCIARALVNLSETDPARLADYYRLREELKDQIEREGDNDDV